MAIKRNFRFKIIHQGRPIVFHEDTIEALVDQAVQFYATKGVQFDRKSIKAQAESQNKPGLIHKMVVPQSKDNPKSMKVRVNLASAYAASKALFNLGRGETVSQKEADRRQSICLNCPHLSDVSDCMACGGMGRAASMLTAVRSNTGLKYQNHISKKFCDVCKCSMALMLATKIEGFDHESDEVNAARPEHCWIKRGGPNRIDN